MSYKLSFKLVSKDGSKIEMKLSNSVSAEDAAALVNNSLAVLETNRASEEDEDDDDDDDDEELEEDEDSPDLSSFDSKTLKSRYPNEDHLKLRIIHHNPDRIDEIVSLMEEKLKMPPMQCYEVISNKEDIGPLHISVADSLFSELHKMGVGVSVKKIGDDRPLYSEDELLDSSEKETEESEEIEE